MASGWRKFAHCTPYPEISANKDHSSVIYGPKADRKFRLNWIQGKRDENEERQIIQWVAETIGEEAPSDMNDVANWLQNGIVINRLFQKLYPGELIRRINEKSSLFSTSENIINFLESAKKSGFGSGDLFELSDLQEKRNIPRVLRTLNALRAKGQRLCVSHYGS